MAVPSAEYWDARTRGIVSANDSRVDRSIPRLNRIYNDAQRRVQADIDAIYRNYSKDTGIDESVLKQLLSKGETDRFWQTLEGRESRQYIRDNYKARITRLEQLGHQIHARAKDIYGKEVKLATAVHGRTVKETHLRTAYDVQHGGINAQFATLNQQRLDQMLMAKWEGGNYATRIWGNTDALADDIKDRLTAGLLAGQSRDRLSREIRERFDVKKYEADRLIRTETSYFENAAEGELYEQIGVDEYTFVATLDSRTSQICGYLDGKRFKLKDRQVGVNWPPMHPNCRSKPRAYFGDEFEPELRRVRDESQADPNEPHSFLAPYQNYEQWARDLRPIYSKVVPSVPAAGVAPAATPQLTTIKNVPDEYIDDVQSAAAEVAEQYPAAYRHVDNLYIAPAKLARQYKTLGEFTHEIPLKGSEIIVRNGVKVQRLTFDHMDTGISILLHKYNRLPEQMLKLAAKNSSGKFTVATSLKGYVYHESAHSLDFTMSLAAQKLTKAYETVHRAAGTKRGIVVPIGSKVVERLRGVLGKDKINPALELTYKELGLTSAAKRKAYLKANVGRYAAESNQEAFSELFAGALQGNKAEIYVAFKRNLDAEITRLGLD